MQRLRTETPRALQRTGARNSLLGPSRSHQLLGQADSMVIEQSVLSLAPTHPPVKKKNPPDPCGSHPTENQRTNQRGQRAPLLMEKKRYMKRDNKVKKE